ncbi:ATP-binding protein [Paenibacillus sp. PL91]|uniref:ATP-binding protein n=1 Tax=Paenibacillus sp. PL91 TaxID=2729538 RepID=UPI00145DD6B4|nr:ATP-binding protein [Paenibacillus sp. PL91]MBC9203326.1 sensor histidine kinase [Paenibacillus sp. PL91]
MSKMKYKISSRATILLGRESVAKVDGAIIEVVKNTYDADANLCFLCFDIEHGFIYILDNGIGMTQETIENYWMLIGTDNKRSEYKSEKNRIKSGEKGIGRFALDRLGSKCEMYTKNQKSPKVILWKTDWSNFEEPGKTIDEVEADFEYLNGKFIDIIPTEILDAIEEINKNLMEDEKILLDTGTLLRISGLRDRWSSKDISKIINSMGFLIPPAEQKDYIICTKASLESTYTIISNELSDEYDYKLFSNFDGEQFTVTLFRNEFDLNKIPNEVFEMEEFKKYPYRYNDFEKGVFKFTYSISEIMNSNDTDLVDSVKKVGSFEFNYTFMKLSLSEDSKETFFYKEISRKRNLWLDTHGGIKIYRDNFLVRPYGDPSSESFDWLGLDARRAKNPAAISHPSGNWHVRNRQGQGTISISRISNDYIIDKSSREGIIENDYFSIFKNLIKNIISVFERDRATIGRVMKEYSDIVNDREATMKASKDIAGEILDEQSKGKESTDNVAKGKENEEVTSKEKVEKLAKAVLFYEEEREELITEIKLLRSLATNGLITTSIVHDLKGIHAVLINRVDAFDFAIKRQNEQLIDRNLSSLRKSDIFLNSWITVITNQIKKDKRKRLKKEVYQTIEEIIEVMSPILEQKKIIIEVKGDEKEVFKSIFVSDFESILYNLIINSIEAFEKSRVAERKITIEMETDQEFILHYRDNGSGLGDFYKNPYDIFKFGVTNKYDKDGAVVGTGLGMYIVASTAREYNARYTIVEYKNGFALDLKFPV